MTDPVDLILPQRCDGCHWYNQEEDKCECDGRCSTCKQSQNDINVKVFE